MSTPPGYRTEDRTVSVLHANLYGLLIIMPLIAVVVLPHALAGRTYLILSGIRTFFKLPWFIFALSGGIVVHELIHGLTWQILSGGKSQAVKYGFQWKSLTPYVQITQPTRIGIYRMGTLAPGFLLGILPLFFGVLFAHPWFTWFGFIFTTAAGGDFVILWRIAGMPSDSLIEDHPSKPGCYVHIPSDQENRLQ